MILLNHTNREDLFHAYLDRLALTRKGEYWCALEIDELGTSMKVGVIHTDGSLERAIFTNFYPANTFERIKQVHY